MHSSDQARMDGGWITQLRKGVLEYCVLLALRGRTSYGYEIVQELKNMEDLEVGESTVYPILSRLGDEGVLSRRRVPSPSGPPRTYYALTLKGKYRLAGMEDYWGRLGAVLEKLRAGTAPGGASGRRNDGMGRREGR